MRNISLNKILTFTEKIWYISFIVGLTSLWVGVFSRNSFLLHLMQLSHTYNLYFMWIVPFNCAIARLSSSIHEKKISQTNQTISIITSRIICMIITLRHEILRPNECAPTFTTFINESGVIDVCCGSVLINIVNYWMCHCLPRRHKIQNA